MNGHIFLRTKLHLFLYGVPEDLIWVFYAWAPDLREPVLEGGGQFLLPVVPAGVHRANNSKIIQLVPVVPAGVHRTNNSKIVQLVYQQF